MLNNNANGMNLGMKYFYIFLICVIFPSSIMSQLKKVYPPIMPETQVEIYKTVDDVELKLWIFNPQKHGENDSRSAIIFFFGGGWSSGSPMQFIKQCEYLADRGMVAIAADYRVRKRHGVKVNSCVEDVKSAIRWMRKNSARLGIDPNRIVASGGSAGGHLAAATETLPGHNDPRDDLSISARPNALVLFNPAVITAPIKGEIKPSEKKIEKFKERLGAEPETLSPYHNIVKGACPTIIFHGTDDPTVRYNTVELFYNKMKEEGNRCELVAYKGEKHGFFNYGRADNSIYIDTLNKMDKFLVSLGILKGAPEIEYYK